MTQKINIALVDDHKVMRSALAGFLSGIEEFEILFEAGDLEEFYSKLTWESKPDVVLMDYGLGDDEGPVGIAYIREHFGEKIKILGLSMHQEARVVKEMIDAGANGYLFKGLDTDEIIKAIRSVHSQGFFINEYTKNMVFGSRKEAELESDGSLTSQENEIIRCICTEMNNEQIASKLNFTVSTINTYRKKILKKTGCKNTAGLVVFAIKNKIFTV